jgi:hypothetical protein
VALRTRVLMVYLCEKNADRKTTSINFSAPTAIAEHLDELHDAEGDFLASFDEYLHSQMAEKEKLREMEQRVSFRRSSMRTRDERVTERILSKQKSFVSAHQLNGHKDEVATFILYFVRVPHSFLPSTLNFAICLFFFHLHIFTICLRLMTD